jgi:hypothetical protein
MVVTGQRTPWIIVARERDQVVVTKLNGTEIQQPVRIDGFSSCENVFVALTSDERHLILAHNEPYFALGPLGATGTEAPPAPESLFPTAPAPESAPPGAPESAPPPVPESAPPTSPARPESEAVPTAAPPKNRSAGNLGNKEPWIERNELFRGTREAGNNARMVYGLVG